jgi:hypothetical protein
MTLDEFRVAFEGIRELGWVKSKRKGPTGIGQTLEQLLGLSENNVALPDLGEIELKAHRAGSPSMITLFTFNRKVWRMNPLQAIRKYGTEDANGRLGLYYTMSRTPNSSGLFLDIGDLSISVRHIDGTLIAEWPYSELSKRFEEKVPAVVLVSALSEMRDRKEWFRFTSARLLSNPSAKTIRNQFLEGNILLDLRLHDKGTSARNHGTGFRAPENNMPALFQNVLEL